MCRPIMIKITACGHWPTLRWGTRVECKAMKVWGNIVTVNGVRWSCYMMLSMTDIIAWELRIVSDAEEFVTNKLSLYRENVVYT